MAKKRSQYWTKKGKKRLLKRNKKGQITDNQSWLHATRQDQKRRSRAERSRG